MKTNIQEINEEVIKAIVSQVLERLAPVSRSTDFYHGAPTDTHLQKINSYLSKATGADDWFVFPVRASDNIVNRSKRKWSVSVLQNMAERTNGVSFLINHDWDDVNASIGFVFDGYLKKEMQAPPTTRQVPDSIEHNSEIINDEGYWCYYAWVAIPRSSDAVGAVEERRQQFVSTGGLVSKMRLLCPICTKEKGFDVGVYDMNEEGKYICPHSLPGYGWWDGTEDMEMPYVVMSGVYDPVEISAVTSGNLPNAEIVR